MLRITLLLALALAPTTAFAQASVWVDEAPGVFVAAHEVPTLVAAGATLLDARSADAFEAGHADGATTLPWTMLVDGWLSGAVHGDDAALARALGEAGVRSGQPVVVYGDWSADAAWGEEGRAWWSLRYLGHDDVRVVYGGVAALQAAGVPFGHAAPPAFADASPFPIRRVAAWRATAADVTASTAVVDTRTREEFGGAVLYGEARGGHVPGAAHLDWRSFFVGDQLIAPDAARARLAHDGDDSPIVAYCTGGVRSAFVVMIATALDIPARNYDASMWSWSSDPTRPLTDQVP